MRSSFFGLNVSTQGLYTAKTALDITNHNIANAETPGYSRQYATLKASRPLQNSSRGMVGTGAEITEIKQYRSEYLDTKYWGMATGLGQFEVKDEMLGQLERLFNEPSDSGYNAYFNDFYDALQTLSTNPGEYAFRTSFLDTAESFATYYNNIGEQLKDYQRDANFGVKASVDEINFLSGQLAAVNNQIANLELNGSAANDLRDERVNILDKLSSIININTKELTDINGKKTFRVSINGQMLVDGNTSNLLKVVPRTSNNNIEDVPELYDVYWQSGKKLYINKDDVSGKLKGYMDIRDGNNKENFTGNVLAGTGTTTLVVANVSKHDIPTSGKLLIDGQPVDYTAISYDEATNQMTFDLVTSAPAGTNVEIGDSVDFKGIPYYTKQLNEFVRTIAKSFNEIHKTGNGNTASEMFSFKGYTGAPPLDETDDFSYNQITIDNFCFSEAIVNDIDLLCSSASANPGESENDIILKLLDLRHDSTLFKKGEAENYMQSLISEIAVDANQAHSFKTGQENLTHLITNQRISFSGVDINEETADMIKYQQAYNLSAKMISIMDEIYDVTINQLVR